MLIKPEVAEQLNRSKQKGMNWNTVVTRGIDVNLISTLSVVYLI